MSAPDWFRAHRFAVVDTETTGVDIGTAEIVQAAALLIDGGRVTVFWSSLARPERGVPKAASDVHGLTEAQLEHAPPWSEVGDALVRMCAGRTIIGYNAAAYDVTLINARLADAGLRGRTVGAGGVLDVLVWVREVDRYVRGKGRHRLEVTAERRGVRVEGQAHDALTDCRLTLGVLHTLWDDARDLARSSLPYALERQRALAADQEARFREWLAQQQAAEA